MLVFLSLLDSEAGPDNEQDDEGGQGQPKVPPEPGRARTALVNDDGLLSCGQWIILDEILQVFVERSTGVPAALGLGLRLSSDREHSGIRVSDHFQ